MGQEGQLTLPEVKDRNTDVSGGVRTPPLIQIIYKYVCTHAHRTPATRCIGPQVGRARTTRTRANTAGGGGIGRGRGGGEGNDRRSTGGGQVAS